MLSNNRKAGMRTSERQKEIERENLILLQKLERIKFGPVKHPSDIGLPHRQGKLNIKRNNIYNPASSETGSTISNAHKSQSDNLRPEWDHSVGQRHKFVYSTDKKTVHLRPDLLVNVNPNTPLTKIDIRELRNIIRESSVDEYISAVFEALMLIVSPFDLNEVDSSWEGARHWVKQLGGTDVFILNLMRFDPSCMRLDNVKEARNVLVNYGLANQGIRCLPQPVQYLVEWIWIDCIGYIANLKNNLTKTAEQSEPEEVYQVRYNTELI